MKDTLKQQASKYDSSIPSMKLQQALSAELKKAYHNGAYDVARLALMKLRTAEVNAHNKNLSDKDYRKVVAEILADVIDKLEQVA